MSSKKKSHITIKIPMEVYQILKIWAEQNNRPIGRELKEIIKEARRTLPVNF